MLQDEKPEVQLPQDNKNKAVKGSIYFVCFFWNGKPKEHVMKEKTQCI
jgi:hypothetical protein